MKYKQLCILGTFAALSLSAHVGCSSAVGSKPDRSAASKLTRHRRSCNVLVIDISGSAAAAGLLSWNHCVSKVVARMQKLDKAAVTYVYAYGATTEIWIPCMEPKQGSALANQLLKKVDNIRERWSARCGGNLGLAKKEDLNASPNRGTSPGLAAKLVQDDALAKEGGPVTIHWITDGGFDNAGETEVAQEVQSLLGRSEVQKMYVYGVKDDPEANRLGQRSMTTTWQTTILAGGKATLSPLP